MDHLLSTILEVTPDSVDRNSHGDRLQHLACKRYGKLIDTCYIAVVWFLSSYVDIVHTSCSQTAGADGHCDKIAAFCGGAKSHSSCPSLSSLKLTVGRSCTTDLRISVSGRRGASSDP